jgi:diguanylate cyclase (GGDEF)-like protein
VLTALLIFALMVAIAVASYGAWRRRALGRELEKVQSSSLIETQTTLRNRRAFIEDLEREHRRCQRTGRPASLIVFGLDVERTVGASRRSESAVVLADVIRATVRQVDVGYRIGVHELALILPETRARGALVAAARIEERLRAHSAATGTVAAGVAEFGPGLDDRQVFRNAYCALLAAGREGRSQILAYSPELARNRDSTGLEGLSDVAAVEGPTP